MDITLIVNTVLKDASKITVKDTTEYTTPARVDFYSNFYAYKVDTNDQETDAIVESQGTPTAVDEWVVETPQDGWYRFKLLLYPVWGVTVPYVIGDVVFHINEYYIALTDSTGTAPDTSIDVDWGVHPNTVADEDVTNLEVGVLNCVLFYRLKTCFAKEVALAASIACECSDDKKPSQLLKYEKLGVMIDGIATDNYQTRYADGEKKVRYMSKMCANCA